MPEEPTHLPLTLKEAVFDPRWEDGSHAVEGVDGRAMTYGELRAKIKRVVGTLNGAGYRRGDRLATVMTNGPEQFALLVCLMAGFTIVPINPALKEGELSAYMRATRVKAAVVEEPGCPAANVAKGLGLEVYELVKRSSGATLDFALAGRGADSAPVPEPDFATEDDLIAVFGTSGTTGRPKIVPVKQSNEFLAFHGYNRAFKDAGGTRFLSFLPIFYAHGLMGPLRHFVSGGCVVFAPAFDPHTFFGWLETARPTGMTAGPALYQAIMEHASENLGVIKKTRLRYISTGNAAMPQPVMESLEKAFNAPVLETYAMTEVPHITTNPIPPGKRKRGSAGTAWSTEVAIADEGGAILPQGKIGEIVVRGGAVFPGYENDPEANAAAFRGGWFRTGDIGYLDEDGYLFIKGRLKDIINRGGEKIAPREVEEALLAHPAIKEAVVFPVKHRNLGEDMAAAVVLKEGSAAAEPELRVWVSKRLAYFKVPSRVLMLREIPKGATGKISRTGMAESLGLGAEAQGAAERVPPRTETERRLVRIIEGIMPSAMVGVNDNLFDLGIYSIMAVRLFNEIGNEFGVRLPLATLYESPGVGDIAALIDGGGVKGGWKRMVALQPKGSDPPLFLIHGGDGDVINYKELVKVLGDGRKIFGIQARGLDGKDEPSQSMEEIVGEYSNEIMLAAPDGPYFLMGFSAGGIIAYEVARRIEALGRKVPFVGIVDMDVPDWNRGSMRINSRRNFFRQIYFLLRDMRPGSPKKRAGLDLKLLKRTAIIAQSGLSSLGIRVGEQTMLVAADAVTLPKARRRVWLALADAVMNCRPGRYRGRVTVFKGQGIPFVNPQYGSSNWGEYAEGGASVFAVPGRMHGSQLRQPNVGYLAKLTNTLIEKASRAA